MPNIDEITDMARRLGIKLTSAQEGSDLYECWAYRVLEAWEFPSKAATAIAAANAYAI